MNEEKVSRRDLYGKLWGSRDFEISHSLTDVEFPCTVHYPAFCIVFSMLDDGPKPENQLY